MAKVIVFGNGTIGKQLIRKLPEYGYDPVLIVTRRGVRTVRGEIIATFEPSASQWQICTIIDSLCSAHSIEFGVLAIPSGGDGLVEANYITTLVRSGIPVVTAGKSALANQFGLLQSDLQRIGRDAACGGGTMIPEFISSKWHLDACRPATATFNLNGTLNFACWRCFLEGIPSEQVCDEAARLLFAEPTPSGEVPTPIELFSGEMADIQRKIAVLFNVCLYPMTGTVVSQSDFPQVPISERDLQRILAGNVAYRYLVRICSRESDIQYFEDVLEGGSIRVNVGGLWVVAGFIRIEGVLQPFARSMAGNAAWLVQGGDSNFTYGEGAGPVPTVGAMMMNLERLRSHGSI